MKPGDGSLLTLLLLWLSAHLGGCGPGLCCPWLGYLALCFYKVGIISGCCLSPVPSCRKKSKSTIIFMTTVPPEICLQGFKWVFWVSVYFGLQEVEKSQVQAGRFSFLDHPFGAGGQGRAVMGGVCPCSSWCPLIMPVVNIQSAV